MKKHIEKNYNYTSLKNKTNIDDVMKLNTFSINKFIIIGIVSEIKENELIITIEEINNNKKSYFNLPIEYSTEFYKKFLIGKIDVLDMVGLRGKIKANNNELSFTLEECELIEKNRKKM